MNKGENNLGLGALGDDLDIGNEDIIMDIPTDVQPTKTPEEVAAEALALEGKENIKPGEELKTPESVAKVEDLIKTPDDKGTSSSSPGENQKFYSSIAGHLLSEGVLPNLENAETVTSVDSLRDAIKAEIDKGVGSLESEYQEAMKGGVPKEEYVAYQKALQQLEGITPDLLASTEPKAVQLRKNVIAQDFLNRGFSKDEALKFAQRSIDLTEDVADAGLSLERLKTFNKEQFDISVKKSKDEKEAVNTDIKKFIESTSEVIKGIPVNQNVKDDLLKSIITPVGNGKDGKPINAFAKAYEEDPVKFQVIQNYLFTMTKGFTDFSKINMTAQSNASKDIDNILKNTGAGFMENGAVNFNNKDQNSSFSLGDFEVE